MKVSNWIKEDLNKEKINILKQDGNVLVTANPGTGKTLLLAYKYLNLLENNVDPKEILCLTFTTKARKELEDRLLKEIKERKIKVNLSDVNVFTFHSFALNDEDEVVSSNLLRYSIYEFFKKEEVLNYSDRYLIDTIIPKMENLLRYLKSYGILPEDINLKQVKNLLESKKNTKEEMDKFAEYFVETYKFYEKIKSSKGIDYSDMLLNFLNQKEIPKFEYVLVDEMQDVNQIEAKIALKCSKNFIVVGDKKQAIMGFQGGSVSNLKLFKNSKQFILSNNFRSGQQILDYAKDKFDSVDKTNEEELKNLKNAKNKQTNKPIVHSVEKEELYPSACELAKKLAEKTNEGQIGIIVRTNRQIEKITEELKARNMEFSSTYFSASKDAKNEIIDFIKGILSNNPKEIQNALFSPFFPIKIQTAFELCKLDKEKIFEKCPQFKEIRDKVKNVRDVDLLFEKYIIPFSVAYGGEYLLASLSVRKSYREALRYIEKMDYKSLIDFISSADLLTQSADSKSKIVVTTVHKAKGLQYDSVIYIPKKPRNNSNFQDEIVETILKTEDIDIQEELLEESLRIDFVAYTRAKNNLHIMTPDPQEYLSDYAETGSFSVEEEVVTDLEDRSKKAFSLFVAGKHDEAKEYLNEKKIWFKPFIEEHFQNLDHTSFSSLNTKPFEYLKRNILKLQDLSPALDLGQKVHSYAEKLLQNKEIEEDEVYFKNTKKLISLIKEKYPEVDMIEEKFNYTVRDLFEIDSDFKFSGKLDAVFTNGEEYLIVDWKTSKNESRGSSYRQQLMAYKKAFALMKNISEEKIKVAIGYVGLRSTINLGKTEYKLDDSQPRSSSIKTLSKKISKILEWKENPVKYLEEFECENTNKDKLWTAICEQIRREGC